LHEPFPCEKQENGKIKPDGNYKPSKGIVMVNSVKEAAQKRDCHLPKRLEGGKKKGRGFA